MSKIQAQAARFHALFAGLERAYGTYNAINKQREDGKRTGDPFTERKPVTDELWQQHLEGSNGIGIVAIRDDATVMFGAIDIDIYADLDPGKIVATLARFSLPLIPCKSKSGGLHVYLFTAEPIAAADMQDKLREIAALLGHGGSEIFPKQAKIVAGNNDVGGWINMPYFQGAESTRYGVGKDGEAMAVDEFLDKADASKVDKAFFSRSIMDAGSPGTGKKEKAEKDPLPDGPPCLNTLIQLGFPPGTSNVGLFNAGIYYRKCRPSDWAEAIEALNARLGERQGAREVTDIVRSLGSKDYQYMCSKQPLLPYCNSAKCRMRKYGVGGGAGSFPQLGQLRKLCTNPPVYYWDLTINDEVRTVELTADEVQDARLFKKAVWAQLDEMIPPVKQDHWETTVKTTRAANFVLVAAPEDASSQGQVWELIERFCTFNETEKRAELMMGRPWIDKATKRVHFRLSDLMRYLTSQQFKEYKVHQLAKVLKTNKQAEHDQVNIAGKFVNLWSLPQFAKQTEGFELPSEDSIF